jgi:hypothetical protein
MNSKFEIYCKIFKTTPKKMRMFLHRYFGTPEHIRELSFAEYSARRDGRPFRGREPRPFIDICMDLEQRKKKNYEKLLEIHESGLFQLILDADDNKDIIAKKLEIWESIPNIAGARKIYKFAPEAHDEQ